MNKPITIVYEDFKKDLADLINKSGLPPFMIESVLLSYLNETRIVSKERYQVDKAEYEKYLASINDNKDISI